MKEGLSAIITGASSGIGRALALKLADKYKARLVLNARRKEAVEKVAAEVEAQGGKAIALDGDISDRKVSGLMAAQAKEKFGGIDLLVNNAGLAKPGPLLDLSPDDWRFVFDVNVFGPLYAIYAVLPHMLAQGKGQIVNVASVAGKVAFPGGVCYSASKFALTGMSEGMAAELSPNNIDVITVCPGWVRTEFFENNGHAEARNPTLIGKESGLRGFLMRHFLSISAAQCADEIIRACQSGGSREIILTAPGVIVDRLKGLAPNMVFTLAGKIPANR